MRLFRPVPSPLVVLLPPAHGLVIFVIGPSAYNAPTFDNRPSAKVAAASRMLMCAQCPCASAAVRGADSRLAHRTAASI
ncbi:hypothetical protein HYPSUDRAFT_42135 [Hypholoma sublateritium FD-334 SS-4]|uniref:Uncharacterized protein n=1 Tax=Hypholoma sublateritium (strain FD-334 SS-4) TaxID=945553 RepID=A0A0D2MCT1_HYPSF|nr:hypothetical protein HYPSUDRAFT_42135 [Hypholoma sublateritium FD-334 SS-4]